MHKLKISIYRFDKNNNPSIKVRKFEGYISENNLKLLSFDKHINRHSKITISGEFSIYNRIFMLKHKI